MWRMPLEGDPHDRTWMAFPREGYTLGASAAQREAGYRAWTAVAHAVAAFEPVTMVVDPSELDRARSMLGTGIEIVEAPLDEFWMRDIGPTFVLDDERPGVLGAVDWVFNGWGAPDWAEWQLSAGIARTVAGHVGAEVVASSLVNEGGGIHVDGRGTVLVTETVQLDPGRNPGLTKADVERELAARIGADRAVWLRRGLTRDYEELGTRGHVDIVATITSPGTVLVHDQRDPGHPDHAVTAEVVDLLAGEGFDVVRIPAPATLRDDEGFVDYSYVNHVVTNGGVVACTFDDAHDAEALDVLRSVYPGREVVGVDAREVFARGGGLHCITQQQPSRP